MATRQGQETARAGKEGPGKGQGRTKCAQPSRSREDGILPNDTLPVITAISANDRSKWRTICLFSSPSQLPLGSCRPSSARLRSYAHANGARDRLPEQRVCSLGGSVCRWRAGAGGGLPAEGVLFSCLLRESCLAAC
ncbi:hypothetical protein ACOMHN_046094 [Nucella lapillus]